MSNCKGCKHNTGSAFGNMRCYSPIGDGSNTHNPDGCRNYERKEIKTIPDSPANPNEHPDALTATYLAARVEPLQRIHELEAERDKLEAKLAELREYYGDGGARDTERNIGAALAAELLLQVARGELNPPFTFCGEKMNEAANEIANLEAENLRLPFNPDWPPDEAIQATVRERDEALKENASLKEHLEKAEKVMRKMAGQILLSRREGNTYIQFVATPERVMAYYGWPPKENGQNSRDCDGKTVGADTPAGPKHILPRNSGERVSES